tara:strand:- start:135 stop:1787 length:1653 start_codon:yes stop_codon:yes gene_type:complete
MQWTLNWFFRELPLFNKGVFDFPIFYPFDRSLALSSNHLGSLPLNLLLNIFSSDWFARGNLWIFSCFSLNAFASFHASSLFFQHYFKEDYKNNKKQFKYYFTLSALAISLSYAYSLPRLYFASHLQTIPHYAMPYFFYFAYRFISEQRNVFCFLSFSVFFFIYQVYLDLHLGLIMIFLSIILLAFYLLHVVLNRFRTFEYKKLLLRILAFVFLSTLFSLPLLYPYFQTTQQFGVRSDEDRDFHSPHYYDLLRHSRISTLYSKIEPSKRHERSVFLGGFYFSLLFLSVLLTIYNLLYLFYKVVKEKDFSLKIILKSRQVSIIALFMPTFLYLHYIFNDTSTQDFFSHMIPGFNSIRTPGRFVIVVPTMLAFTFLLLYFKLCSFKKIKFYLILSLFFCFQFIELASVSFPSWQKNHLNTLDSLLSFAKGPFIVLPYDTDARNNTDIMQIATEKRLATANGYSGFFIPAFQKLIKIQHNKKIVSLIEELHKKGYWHVILNSKLIKILPEELLKAEKKNNKWIIKQSGSYFMVTNLDERQKNHRRKMNNINHLF